MLHLFCECGSRDLNEILQAQTLLSKEGVSASLIPASSLALVRGA